MALCAPAHRAFAGSDFCGVCDWHPPPAGRPEDESALDCDDPRYALL